MTKLKYISALFFVLETVVLVKGFTEECYEDFCFVTAGQNITRDFYGSKDWCEKNNSWLVNVTDDSTQLALANFLNLSPVNSTIYINLKRYQIDYTWFYINGSRFLGNVVNQEPRQSNYKLYCRLCGSPYYYLEAANPSDPRPYICEYEEGMCPNSTASVFHIDGRCHVIYDSINLTWYEARQRCRNNSGDLSKVTNPYALTLQSRCYWIGVRWNNWQWKTSDGTNETIFTNWSNSKPNNYDYECVCLDRNSTPAWSWTDCDCQIERQVVCLKANIKTTTSVATSAITIGPTPTVVPVQLTVVPTNFTKTGLSALQKDIAIGLGVGIGGCVVIAGVVLLAVYFIRKRRKRQSSERIINTSESYDNLRQLSKDRSKVLVVSDNNTDYAAVVAEKEGTQGTANEETRKDIIYSTPDFNSVSNSNTDSAVTSAPGECDQDSIIKGRVKTIIPQNGDELYANT